VQVTFTDASWIAVGEMLYIATAGGATSAGALQVTGKSGNLVTLLNPATVSAIPPADNTQSGLMNVLSGNATDYIGGDNASHPLYRTLTTAGFTIPAIGSSIVIPVTPNNWCGAADPCSVLIYDANHIFMGEMTAGGSTSITVFNRGSNISNSPGGTLVSGATVDFSSHALASPTNVGILNRLSGNATDFVGGDNTCHSLAAINTFITKTGTYTLTPADSGKYVICSGGSWTLTLPAPVIGLSYRLRNDMGISGTTGTITLQPTGGTIDGASTLALLPQQECTLITDGTNWRTFELRREVILGTLDITSGTSNSSIILLPVGYRYFELEFDAFQPSNVPTGDYIAGQFSTNGGSTWQTTGYYQGLMYNSTATATIFQNSENIGNFYILPSNISSIALGRLVIYPGAALTYPTFRADSSGRLSAPTQYQWHSYGFFNAQGVINALKINCPGGANITTLFTTVKGVV
jgi:hypothetical protein